MTARRFKGSDVSSPAATAGWLSPRATKVMRLRATPASTKRAAIRSARRSDNRLFASELPTLSAWPTTRTPCIPGSFAKQAASTTACSYQAAPGPGGPVRNSALPDSK